MTRGRNHQNGKAGNETMQVSSRRDSDAMIVQEGYARARRNDDSTLEKRLKDNGRRKTTKRRKWCTSNRCQERAATQILVSSVFLALVPFMSVSSPSSVSATDTVSHGCFVAVCACSATDSFAWPCRQWPLACALRSLSYCAPLHPNKTGA